MKITEALLAEHVVFHNLFDYVERVVPKVKTLGEVCVLSSLLDTMLKTHSKVEDRLLIDPLEAAFSQMAQADNFHDEHHQIEQSLDSIPHCDASPMPNGVSSRRSASRESILTRKSALSFPSRRSNSAPSRCWSSDVAGRNNELFPFDSHHLPLKKVFKACGLTRSGWSASIRALPRTSYEETQVGVFGHPLDARRIHTH